MKRSFQFALGALAAVVLPVSIVWAASSSSDMQSFRLGDDLFIAGQSVIVDEDVEGDLYVAGENIHVNGDVGGDVTFGAHSLTIDGEVAGTVRGGGQSININGSVGQTVLIGGQDISINEGLKATVKNIMIGGQRVIVNRPVSGALAVGAYTLELDGPVAGQADIAVEEAILGDSATLGEIVTYYNDKDDTDTQTELEAITAGTLTRKDATHYDKGAYKSVAVASFTASALGQLLSTLTAVLFALVIYWLFPKATSSLVELQRKRTWLVVLFGILSIPLVGIVALIMFVTGVFAPLALLLLVLSIPVVILSIASVYQNTGQALSKSGDNKKGLAIVVGGIVFWILYLIPVVGALVGTIAFILGTGSVIVMFLQSVKALPAK